MKLISLLSFMKSVFIELHTLKTLICFFRHFFSVIFLHFQMKLSLTKNSVCKYQLTDRRFRNLTLRL